MLGQLHIKNIGIIDEITMNFEDGFTVLTGETGSGKSLIIGSIAAVTGSRISKDFLKTGAESALIEAYFFEDEKDVILSREIFANGRNICKIDGKMVPLSELKEVGESLIDIHGQHDNQSLLNPAMHLYLLDCFIGEKMSQEKEAYYQELMQYRQLKQELETQFGDEKERARKIELLQYQIDEIENAHLKIGEEEELQARRNLILNAEKIAKSLSNTYYNLNDIVVENLGMAVHELSGIANLGEDYDKILYNMNEAYYMIKDAASDTLDAMNAVEFDEREQNTIEERLDLLFHLKKKYGNDVESILKYYEDTAEELDRLQNSDAIIGQLKEELTHCTNRLEMHAQKMRKMRQEKAKEIAQCVNQELKELEMKNAQIEFQLKELENFHETGKDDAQIFIVTNLGEEMKPVHKIASGGEISRVMLALKTVFADVDEIPCLIFDEIDTGISGEVAKKVGEKMKKISQNHQLLCITHLPMIVSWCDSHFLIEKREEEGKTHTSVRKLQEEETIREMARMLGGNKISAISLEHAKELRKDCKVANP